MQNVFTKKWVMMPIILFALLALIPLGASAKVVAFADNVYLGADEVVDDNYIVGGGTVEIAGTVNGDIYALGGTATVTGTVGGDVIVAGGTVTITGDVMGNVRVAGGAIDVSGTIGKNLTIFGGTVKVGADTTVGWSVIAYGGTVDLRGTVHGNADIGGGSTTVGATINGALTIDAGEEDTNIILLPTMSVGKDLHYTYATTLTVDSTKVGGEVVHSTYEPKTRSHTMAAGFGFMFAKVMFGFFTTLVLGMALIAIAKTRMGEVTRKMRHEVGTSMLWGVLYVLVSVVMGILLMITIVGMKIAMLNFMLLGVAMMLASVLISIAVGQQVKKWLNIKAESMMLSLFIGAVLSYAIMLIPFIGWFLALLAGAWAIGAMVQYKWAWLHAAPAKIPKVKK